MKPTSKLPVKKVTGLGVAATGDRKVDLNLQNIRERLQIIESEASERSSETSSSPTATSVSVNAIDASSGPADAGKLIKANYNGKLDNTFLSIYIHTQTIADTEWNISHGLGLTLLNVDMWDEDGIEIDGDVEFVDENNVMLTFTQAVAGTARLT